MKTYKVLFLALIVSVSLAISAQAGDRHGNNDNSQRGPARGRGSAPMMHSSSGFRSGGNRMFARPSGVTMRSMPQFSQRRMIGGENTSFVPRQFTSRTFSGGGNNNGVARFENNRRTQTNRFAELQGHHIDRFTEMQAPSAATTIGVRTEHLRISKSSKGAATGRVIWIEHLGDRNHLHLKVGESDVVTLADLDAGLGVGDDVAIEVVKPLYFDRNGERISA